MAPIHPFRPTDQLLRPSPTCIRRLRIRGCCPESANSLSARMRTRMVGVLKFADAPNHVPAGCISTSPVRDGGATTTSHSAYGLLEVKEWGRRGPAFFHGRSRYDMHTMRWGGKRMDVSTGLFGCAKLKPHQTKAASFRTGCKEKYTKPKPPFRPAVIFLIANPGRNSGIN